MAIRRRESLDVYVCMYVCRGGFVMVILCVCMFPSLSSSNIYCVYSIGKQQQQQQRSQISISVTRLFRQQMGHAQVYCQERLTCRPNAANNDHGHTSCSHTELFDIHHQTTSSKHTGQNARYA